MRAMNSHVERVFNPSRKEEHSEPRNRETMPDRRRNDGNLRLTDGGAIRTLDFNVSSETFAVSAVPLPPALPLFAAALLALGIFGYVRRAKDVTAVQT
jgi:hypothetical protein